MVAGGRPVLSIAFVPQGKSDGMADLDMVVFFIL